ncbi:MAG: nucleotide exchange factor GrpE [Planctomycetota bacterium]|nr:nucleotide exchange factor GrpE [Planctomycetota bacterium]
MKHKDKEKPKEEQQEQKENELTDFYGLLESLLPLRSELLQDLRATLKDCKKRSEETLPSDKNEADYVLELEKEKTKWLLELYKVAVNQYLRVSADYANSQKRVPKQIADAIGYEKEKIIRTLLPALDNFERMLQNAQPAENAESVVKGIKITYDHTLDILRSHGIEQIKSLGEKFDPALHEAITQKSEPEKEEGVVLEEFAKGYKLNGRVIRPSKVIVNKVTSKLEKASEQEETTDTELLC